MQMGVDPWFILPFSYTFTINIQLLFDAKIFRDLWSNWGRVTIHHRCRHPKLDQVDFGLSLRCPHPELIDRACETPSIHKRASTTSSFRFATVHGQEGSAILIYSAGKSQSVGSTAMSLDVAQCISWNQKQLLDPFPHCIDDASSYPTTP